MSLRRFNKVMREQKARAVEQGDIEDFVPDALAPAWQRLADAFEGLSTKEFKTRLAALSPADQQAAWKAISEQEPGENGRAQDAIRGIDVMLKNVVNRVPSGPWFDDVKGLPGLVPAVEVYAKDDGSVGRRKVRVNRGGEFPPGGRHTLMRRARGERRIYPQAYLTSSGHSWDAWVQKVYLGQVQYLREEPNDGYRSSFINVRDLPPAERRHFNRIDERMKGKRGSRTNSVNPAEFDGISD